MVQSQFALSWEGYKSSLSSGFSSLQQNGEFVDMTLAADGHYVKVHQVLIALVSPYLKDLITSAPCQHPVIFLNNVSHKVLNNLLEYVYTGEVQVHSENLSSFVETAKALHIKGLEDLQDSDNTYKVVDSLKQLDETIPCHVSGTKKLSIPDGSSSQQFHIPAAATKIVVKPVKFERYINKPSLNTMSIEAMSDDNVNYSDVMESSTHMNDDDSDTEMEATHLETEDILPIGSSSKNMATSDNKSGTSNLQFSVSIRGSLQIILNRYIYNLHSTTHRTGVRRWRCVDYRNNRCKAFVVTKGNVVLNRANLHNHPFHDKKILQKIEKKSVFSALDDLEVYKHKEEEARKEADDNAIHQKEYIFEPKKV